MKTPKKATVDFGGALTDDISRKGSRLFPVEFDDSDLGNFNQYRKRSSAIDDTKQKFNKQIANRRSKASIKKPFLPGSTQYPHFPFHLYDDRSTKGPKKASAKDVIKIIKRHLHDDPTVLDRWPEFRKPSFIRRFAKMQLDEEERRHRENENTKAVYSAFVLKEIESSSYCGRLHLDKRGKVINEIQAIVSEFLIEQTFFMPTLDDSSSEKLFLRRELPTTGAKGGMDIFSLSQTNIPAIVNDALYLKARKILGLLWELSDAGDNGALMKIAKTLLPNISALNKRLSNHPDMLAMWPRTMPVWPVLKSLHRHFDSNHVQFLSKLQLGDALFIGPGGGERWEMNIISKWGIYVFQRVEDYRAWVGCEDCILPSALQKRLLALQKLSSDTWTDWWEVIQSVLEHDYIDLATVPELRDWVNTDKPRSKRIESGMSRGTAHHQKPDSQIRKFIYRALKEKIASLAGANKSKQTSPSVF